jgi:hypothetical protein
LRSSQAFALSLRWKEFLLEDDLFLMLLVMIEVARVQSHDSGGTEFAATQYEAD